MSNNDDALALREAADFLELNQGAWNKVSLALAALAEFLDPYDFKDDVLINIIGGFNDSPDVTLDMVVTALRETASKLEASS